MSSSAATKKAVRKSSKKRAYETSELNAQLTKEEKIDCLEQLSAYAVLKSVLCKPIIKAR